MTVRFALPDMISPSYFPLIAAVELGHLEREGVDASLELAFPVTDSFVRLRDGDLDYVAGSAHAALHAFPDWEGCRLLASVQQAMYWFLVVRADVEGPRGDLEALRGLRIGAAPGPVDGLKLMLRAAGIDPDDDVSIAPVPTDGTSDASFGVLAAQALADGRVDAFWANGMAAELAVRDGSGRVLVDARRPPHPPDVDGYTFSALLATQARVDAEPDEVRAVVRALGRAQQDLRDDPSIATRAAATRFPAHEQSLIADVVARDTPFYTTEVPDSAIARMQVFAHALGLASRPEVDPDDVVAAVARQEWTR